MDWIISDTHYNHKNIVTGTSEWSDGGQREFDTLEDHDEAIVKNINDLVKPMDRLFHLGDWSFGGKHNIVKFRSKILCKNIFLTYGNHDEHILKNKEIDIDDSDLPTILKIVEYNLRSSSVKNYHNLIDISLTMIKETKKVFAKDLFLKADHIINQTFSVNGEKYKAVLCHWPMRVWDKCSKGTIMLHGHSHGSLDIYKNKKGSQYKTMDCGVDTNNLKPYLIDDIIEKMNKCMILNDADHHDGSKL